MKKLLEAYFEEGLANIEEKKSGTNKPDFVIRTREGKELVGYIEAKDFPKQDDLEFFDDEEQIDELVYKLYGLTPQEIKVVEKIQNSITLKSTYYGQRI